MINKYKKSIIVCDENINLKYDQNIFYVGVERGCLGLIKNKININLSISDFDSVNIHELDLIKKNTKDIVILKKEKHYIDGEIAIKKILSMGFKKIDLYFPINNRVDMTFSSIYFANKYNINIHINNNLIEPIYNNKTKTLVYNKYKEYKYISIIPIVKSKIVLKNLKYGENRTLELEPFTSMGISNELIKNKTAYIDLILGECVLFLIK